MRPIKFKLWDKINKKWVDTKKYDIYIDKDGYGSVGFWWEYRDTYGYKQREYIVATRVDHVTETLRNQFEIVLWTGLKDKNNTEIYEGDIVMLNHWKSSDIFDYNKPFVVDYINGQVFFKQGDYYNFIGNLVGELEIEVVGNIYENNTPTIKDIEETIIEAIEKKKRAKYSNMKIYFTDPKLFEHFKNIVMKLLNKKYKK